MFSFAALSFPEFSPFLITIGPVPIRWYAISYILGMVCSFYYASKLITRPKLWGGVASPITKDDMDEIFTWSLLGIILGGRLGYLLFYTLPYESGRQAIAENPWSLIKLWEGGLSFHGGFLGVCLAIFLVARMRKIPLLSFADMGAMITPITIFSVRVLGNFMNAELYGRHTTSPLGMIFPEGYSPDNAGPPVAWDAVEKTWIYLGTEMPRHPSQIYEGILEGLIPTIVLAVLAWRYQILKKPGLATGLFFVMYGVGRSIAENFREPDQHIGTLFGGVTTGMLLSTPMWIAGAFLIWNALKSKPLSAAD